MSSYFRCINISIIAVLLEHSDPSCDNCHVCLPHSLPRWQLRASGCDKCDFASQTKSNMLCYVKSYVYIKCANYCFFFVLFGASMTLLLSFNLFCLDMVGQWHRKRIIPIVIQYWTCLTILAAKVKKNLTNIALICLLKVRRIRFII